MHLQSASNISKTIHKILDRILSEGLIEEDDLYTMLVWAEVCRQLKGPNPDEFIELVYSVTSEEPVDEEDILAAKKWATEYYKLLRVTPEKKYQNAVVSAAVTFKSREVKE